MTHLAAQPTVEHQEKIPTHESYDDDIKNVDELNDDKSDQDLTEHRLPTDEERATLRLVSANIPWAAYAIAVVEFGA